MAGQIGELLHTLEDGDQPVRALAGRRPGVFLDYDAPRGTGIFVERTDDPEVAERTTAADYVLYGAKEVERFLDTLAR